ncbi:hypothetical protein DERF_001659 [Dermatophagoides farinae]|uniref:Uncharacterized protein n=1 Tax=Dermatophagoides farinae TaxID=6954 RepID=A0A922LBD1_DERFA|nr:hypothetical protein DERF_001659 [Dermatophagoides farinae]
MSLFFHSKLIGLFMNININIQLNQIEKDTLDTNMGSYLNISNTVEAFESDSEFSIKVKK